MTEEGDANRTFTLKWGKKTIRFTPPGLHHIDVCLRKITNFFRRIHSSTNNWLFKDKLITLELKVKLWVRENYSKFRWHPKSLKFFVPNSPLDVDEEDLTNFLETMGVYLLKKSVKDSGGHCVDPIGRTIHGSCIQSLEWVYHASISK